MNQERKNKVTSLMHYREERAHRRFQENRTGDGVASLNRITGLNWQSMPESLVNRHGDVNAAHEESVTKKNGQKTSVVHWPERRVSVS